MTERSNNRILKKEFLLAKMESIDSDQTQSSGSSDSSHSDTNSSDTEHNIGGSDSDEDSVKKLEKKVRRKKKAVMHRRAARLKREEELREKEKRLNELENAQNHYNGGNASRAGGDGAAVGGLPGLNSNNNPAAIDQVAEILRALKGKGAGGQSFASVVPSPGGLPQSGPLSPNAPLAPPSPGRKSDIRNKFKSAVRKSKAVTNMNKMAGEAVVKRERRSGINLAGNIHALSQVGNLVTTMNSKLKRAEDRKKMSGLAKFLSSDLTKVRHDDFDSGVNAMALLCALVLSVPYQVAGTLDYDNLDWMKGQVDECEDTSWTYGVVYTGYRITFIMTVYFSISGMIIATFFFLFKRNNDFDYKIWRSKARYMVVLLFLCTALAIIALILFTNLYFDYYLLSTTDNICDNNTLPYVLGGSGLALSSFVVAFYLIL